MPNFWLVKTEPSQYSFDDLLREKKTVWSGVKNNLALIHLRSMKKGDSVLVYHSGTEKAIVGLAEIVSGPYPDPALKDPRIVVVDLKPKKKLDKPVSLAQIKADKQFERFQLLRFTRLSVMPVERPIWDAILKMAQ